MCAVYVYVWLTWQIVLSAWHCPPSDQRWSECSSSSHCQSNGSHQHAVNQTAAINTLSIKWQPSTRCQSNRSHQHTTHGMQRYAKNINQCDIFIYKKWNAYTYHVEYLLVIANARLKKQNSQQYVDRLEMLVQNKAFNTVQTCQVRTGQNQ